MVAPITPTGQTRSLFNLTTTQNISKVPTPPTDKEQISNLTPGKKNNFIGLLYNSKLILFLCFKYTSTLLHYN